MHVNPNVIFFCGKLRFFFATILNILPYWKGIIFDYICLILDFFRGRSLYLSIQYAVITKLRNKAKGQHVDWTPIKKVFSSPWLCKAYFVCRCVLLSKINFVSSSNMLKLSMISSTEKGRLIFCVTGLSTESLNNCTISSENCFKPQFTRITTNPLTSMWCNQLRPHRMARKTNMECVSIWGWNCWLHGWTTIYVNGTNRSTPQSDKAVVSRWSLIWWVENRYASWERWC